ncbi:MAG: hypothetical protein K8R74_08155, partial [Bacteroidales bacterium]|nr:hypothetical protein [Bacteroidales bacterium]
MKKYSVTLGFIFFGLSLISNATVWRLNNIEGVDADFKINLQDVINNVTSGDTIHVEPSPFSYGGATISKKIVLLGAGYWLNENDSTQANKENSIIENLVLNPGSEGSVVCGLFLYHEFPSSWIQIEINADSITIQRNYFYGRLSSCSGGQCTGYNIAIYGTRKAIVVQQNWIESNHYGYYAECIHIDNIPDDIVIKNNFLKPYSTLASAYGLAISEATSHETTGLVINNNVIWGNIFIYNALHVNNILLTGSYYNGTGGLTANNLCNENQYPDINNNQQYIDMSTVFVDHDLNIDNGYILAPGSAAIDAAYNGEG